MRFYSLSQSFLDWMNAQERYSEAERAEFLEALESEVNPSHGLRALYPQHYRAHLAAHLPEALPDFDACVGPLPERPADFASLRQALSATLFTAMTTQGGTSIAEDITRFSTITAEGFNRYAPGQALKLIGGENLIEYFQRITMIIPTLYNCGAGRIETSSKDAVRVVIEGVSGAHIVHLVWRGTAHHITQGSYQIESAKLSPESFYLNVERVLPG